MLRRRCAPLLLLLALSLEQAMSFSSMTRGEMRAGRVGRSRVPTAAAAVRARPSGADGSGDDDPPPPFSLLARPLDRRSAAAAATVLLGAAPRAAHAAFGEFEYDVDRLSGDTRNPLEFAARRLDYLFRPAPPAQAALRERLDRDFAVLLMRTSYAVADDLDFVPMDEFQRDFFLLRQRDYQYYLDALFATSGLRPEQGDLTDPSYFDFISYAQYATIDQDMARGRVEFNEKIIVGDEANGTLAEEVVRVVRDGSLPRDDARGALGRVHAARVGARVLEQLLEKNDKGLAASLGPSRSKAALAVVPAPLPTLAEVERASGQLLNLMRVNGYALASSTTVKPKGSGATLELRLTAPATLWGQRSIAQGAARGGALTNDFEVKIVCAYLDACGVQHQSAGVRFDGDLDVVHKILLPGPGLGRAT